MSDSGAPKTNNENHEDQHGIVRPRCFPGPHEILPFDPEVEIPRHCSILVTRYPPVQETFAGEKEKGIGAGPTSIAYALFAMADGLPPVIEGKSPMEWAKLYLKCAQNMADWDRDANLYGAGLKHCGLAHEGYALSVVSAAIEQDNGQIDRVLAHLPEVLCSQPKDQVVPDELAAGRAGYLYFLRLMDHYCSALPSHSRIRNAYTPVIDAIIKRGPDTQDLWKYAQRAFIGAAHGWIGTIVQILLCEPTLHRLNQCRPWLITLLDAQLPTGNWNMILDESQWARYQKNLVQIGHGAPGMLLSLWSLRPLYAKIGDEEMVARMDRAVDAAQEVIWEKGLLTKQSCLWHGAAGNSLALIDKQRRGTFLAHSTFDVLEKGLADGSLEPSSSPSGLKRGLVGVIWAMVEYQRGRLGVSLVYNDV